MKCTEQKMKKIFLLFLLIVAPINLEASTDGDKLWQEVIENVTMCNLKTKMTKKCFIDSVPSKCEDYVLEMFLTQEKNEARKGLSLCVKSCANASIFSRQFGECSRKIK